MPPRPCNATNGAIFGPENILSIASMQLSLPTKFGFLSYGTLKNVRVGISFAEKLEAIASND
jgi:hypothetical protein